VALYSTSLARFGEVWEAFHAREPFCSRADFGSLEASGQLDRLRTDLLADLERIDPGAATGIWGRPRLGHRHGRLSIGRDAIGDPAASAHAADRA
jgi:hypothetical protein